MWKKLGVAALMGIGLSCAVAACRPGPKAGSISPDGYRHATYPYGVVRPPGEDLLPPDWVLDNYYLDGRKIKAKQAPEYLTTYHLDTNSDGFVDRKVKSFRYDLLFIHRLTSARIFVRTVPQSYEVANLGLDVLARRYVDAVAGGDYEVVEFGEEGHTSRQVMQRKRYITTIESSGPATLASLPAFEVTLALRDVEQAAQNDNRPEERWRVVFCRPGFAFHQGSGSRGVDFPVLLIASYAALPEKFEQGIPDFQRFLADITFGRSTGYAPPSADPAAPDPADASVASSPSDAAKPPEAAATPAARSTASFPEAPAAPPVRPDAAASPDPLGF